MLVKGTTVFRLIQQTMTVTTDVHLQKIYRMALKETVTRPGQNLTNGMVNISVSLLKLGKNLEKK
jgi:poly(3-hydroxyalkanoate) synthetase